MKSNTKHQALQALALISAMNVGTEVAAENTATETTAEEAPKVEKPKMPSQNGVTRPRPETKCGQVWGIADKMSAEKKSPVAVADLLVETDKLGLNQGNVRCEYAAWRKFHGVTGRILSDKQIAEKAQKEAEKEKKKAEREAAKEAKAKEKAEAKAKREAERAEKKAAAEKAKAEKAEAKAKAKAEKEAKAAEAKAKKEAEAKAKAEAAANAATDSAE